MNLDRRRQGSTIKSDRQSDPSRVTREPLLGIARKLCESPDLALGRFFLHGESLAELARAIQRAKDSGLTVEVFVHEADTLFAEVWSAVMMPMPTPMRNGGTERRFLTKFAVPVRL